MNNKNKLSIIIGVIILIVVSFIVGFLIGQKNIQKTNTQINKIYNSIPLQIEIKEIVASKTEAEIKKYTLTQEEIYIFFDIIKNLTFSNVTCDGLATHIISYSSAGKRELLNYSLEAFGTTYHIQDGGGEAILSDSQKAQLEKIVNKLYN